MKKRILSLLLALIMVLSLAACGAQNDTPQTSDTKKQDAETTAGETHMNVEDSDFFGPIYDEWSEMTDEELYELAKEEVDKRPHQRLRYLLQDDEGRGPVAGKVSGAVH